LIKTKESKYFKLIKIDKKKFILYNQILNMELTVIAGKLKGRKILFKIPDNKSGTGKTIYEIGLRPILARVKKSLFDILRQKIKNSYFLDLYAGSGSVGIEAISRDSKYVVFIDHDSYCLKQIEQNLNKFGISNTNYKVYKYDILDGLGWLKNTVKFFDIIFIGPPYKELLVNRTLEIISDADILANDGWIIAQHHKKEKINPVNGLLMFRQENYGDTLLSFFKKG
jgi:16S rRNA (guanine(966)-N(2))-methyltransferase RsmD